MRSIDGKKAQPTRPSFPRKRESRGAAEDVRVRMPTCPNLRRKVGSFVLLRYDMHAVFGGMAERLNAAVLKTVVSEAIPQVRILLPPPFLRNGACRLQTSLRRDAGAAEQGSLLSCCGAYASPRVRIPLSPPYSCAPVAQWIRARDYGSRSREFESSRARHLFLKSAQPCFL